MFADRKRVFVYVPKDKVPEKGPLFVGVPRSSRRITLLACISPDGTKLCQTIITRTKTINTACLRMGLVRHKTPQSIPHQKSFITSEVFGEWLCDVFFPK